MDALESRLQTAQVEIDRLKQIITRNENDKKLTDLEIRILKENLVLEFNLGEFR
jgi:hypothetical protein